METSHPEASQSALKVPLQPASHTLPRSLKGPLGSHLPPSTTSFSARILSILQSTSSSAIGETPTLLSPIQRHPDIQTARLLLPILAEEQQIVETILLNPVVLLQGETGSGKTSQVVQFLYERGWGREEYDHAIGKWKKKADDHGVGYSGMIGITQPRRVAAISMASRVAEELSPDPKSPSRAVAHQIRHSTTLSPATRIKFMTEGVLLRELSSDFLLRKYGVLILDEVHERSLGVDVLIGALSRVVRLREEMWTRGESDGGWVVTVGDIFALE